MSVGLSPCDRFCRGFFFSSPFVAGSDTTAHISRWAEQVIRRKGKIGKIGNDLLGIIHVILLKHYNTFKRQIFQSRFVDIPDVFVVDTQMYYIKL